MKSGLLGFDLVVLLADVVTAVGVNVAAAADVVANVAVVYITLMLLC